MLAFPHWPMEIASTGCRALQWAPPPHFAPYIARPVVPSSPPLQVDDEDSSGGSSPERNGSDSGEISVCEWRGCESQFTSISRLSSHVARTHAHPHQDGLFYCCWRGCTRPQRGFNARYKMLVHVRTHTNERPHTCTQCNKSFSRAENLKIHLRSHSGEKPYVCPYEGCGKAYSNSSDRFKHTRTHTVDKPYCCKVNGCNKRYTDPSSLRKHVKTYKHFAPKSPSSNDVLIPEPHKEVSPLRESNQELYKPYLIKSKSPVTSSTRTTVSPSIPLNSTTTFNIDRQAPQIGNPIRYSPISEQVTYVKPLERMLYPLRIPAYEMSYLEYTHMYEHAYRSYYSNSFSIPTQTLYEKSYTFDYKSNFDVSVKERCDSTRYNNVIGSQLDMPLDLKRVRNELNCQTESLLMRPVEDSMEFELVKCIDLPLDLSTKS